jgi:peptide/nickel transport system ATP-binding protein
VRIQEIADVLVVRETLAATVGPDLAPADSVLRVDNVRKVYPVAASGSVALAGVSISVGEGERVGLVGESGSGKTTLARCVVGLERPSSGTITIGAVDATDYDRLSTAARAQARRSVQIVFQDPYSTLNPARSVGFTLREAARMTDEKPTVAELLGLVGLPASYAERKPFALSGGERQRIAIARALARRPQVLICDEPVSALDVSVQAQILNLLLELNERLGLGYLFITHDLAVVRQVTDRLYVLHRGEVVESGPTERVLDAPAHDYTKTLIDSTPQSDPSWLAPASASVPL